MIPKPGEPYASLIHKKAARLRIGWATEGLMGMKTDGEVAGAVAKVARVLADMGHEVTEESPQFDGLVAMRNMMDVWFFGFDLRLAGYSKRSGHAIGPDTRAPGTSLQSRIAPVKMLVTVCVEKLPIGFELFVITQIPSCASFVNRSPFGSTPRIGLREESPMSKRPSAAPLMPTSD